MSIDQQIIELAARYRPLAAQILREAIRIPADWVARDGDDADPSCGLSNHEGPRLEYLKRMLVEERCVASADDAWFDDFGNLVWQVRAADAKGDEKLVLFDGHSDTVNALREDWPHKIGEGMDAYRGLEDASKIDAAFLRSELGHVPPEAQWDELVFGRGAADQLGGVVCQMIATKIMLELADEGALNGVVVRSYATVAEEDNDGGGPMFVLRELEGAEASRIPDCVVLTEGTGDARKGALGIYRGQRGRMQIEVEVVGKSCHGSMPWEGLNPLEYGAAIIVEARERYDARDGFGDDSFLGHGTRTASWARVDTPSDCAVPERFLFRFDRRLTVGESPTEARRDVECMTSVAQARNAGLDVVVRIPVYDTPTWRGFVLGNEAVYPGWTTPDDHRAIRTAAEAYGRVVAPTIPEDEPAHGGTRRREARIDRWIFSTDGVGFLLPRKQLPFELPSSKNWIAVGAYTHPPMFGFGPGIEQNTHKIGECVDSRELESVCALLACFPSLFAAAD
jgi:putative selenium metabolism hydrolase